VVITEVDAAEQRAAAIYLLDIGVSPGRDKVLLMAATRKTHRLGINPGGSILSSELPRDAEIHPSWFDRLLTREQVERFNDDGPLEPLV
jgi:hypothetical protein